MLVLSRKSEQAIQIGDSITITILNVKGKTVRVGIEAPRGIRVIRSELPVFTETPAEAIDDQQGGLATEQDETDLPLPTPKPNAVLCSKLATSGRKLNAPRIVVG